MRLIHFYDVFMFILVTGFLIINCTINNQKIWTLEEISFQSSLGAEKANSYTIHKTVVANDKSCEAFLLEADGSSMVRLLISAQECNR